PHARGPARGAQPRPLHYRRARRLHHRHPPLSGYLRARSSDLPLVFSRHAARAHHAGAQAAGRRGHARLSMTPMVDFPPLDFERSRFTGWTRAHWVALLARLTAGYARAAARGGSPARALYPDDRRGLPDAADAIESFARMASA